MKKKVLFTITALALAGLVAAGATLAYFTSSDTATNVITTGNVGIQINETSNENKEDYEYTPNVGIVYKKPYTPGSVISKIPTVENTGSNSAYVRVRFEFQDNSGNAVSFNGHELPILDIQDEWKKTDGTYYYYPVPLEAGKETGPVFTTVTIPTSWDNSMSGIQFNVVVKAEAIQSDNNSDDVITAFGNADFDSPNAQPAPDNGVNGGIESDGNNGLDGENSVVLPTEVIPSAFIPRAQYYASKTAPLIAVLNDKTAAKSKKDEAATQIREIMDLPETHNGLLRNDDFRDKLVKDFSPFPTVAEEGLADVFGFNESEASSYYLNAYVSPADRYKVFPYISKNSGTESQKWAAYYVQVDGIWYKPAAGKSSDIGGMVNGWDAIKEKWTPMN